jgi:hypothetical protein
MQVLSLILHFYSSRRHASHFGELHEKPAQNKHGQHVIMALSSTYQVQKSFFWAKTHFLWKKYLLPNLVFTASDVFSWPIPHLRSCGYFPNACYGSAPSSFGYWCPWLDLCRWHPIQAIECLVSSARCIIFGCGDASAEGIGSLTSSFGMLPLLCKGFWGVLGSSNWELRIY